MKSVKKKPSLPFLVSVIEKVFQVDIFEISGETTIGHFSPSEMEVKRLEDILGVYPINRYTKISELSE
jgi:hypothetical protein